MKLHTSHENRFKRFLEEKQLSSVPIAFFTASEAEQYKNWLIAKELAVKTINESLTYMTRYFKTGFKSKWVLSNCFEDIEPVSRRRKRKENGKAEKFEPITTAEMKRIFPMLREKGEVEYIIYLSIIYYAWPRPVEISRLRISNVDLERDIISFASNDTKNLSYASVQIVPQLKKLLESIALHRYPQDYYLFSRDGMKPGPMPLGESYISKKWKRLV